MLMVPVTNLNLGKLKGNFYKVIRRRRVVKVLVYSRTCSCLLLFYSVVLLELEEFIRVNSSFL